MTTKTNASATEAPDSKAKIYRLIADFVKAKTGKEIGKSGGQDLFNLTVEQVFAATVADKTFRFNGGYGSLRLREYSAGSRKLPSGKSTTFGVRTKVRYEQGVSTTNLVLGKPVKTTQIPAPAAEAAPAAAPATTAAPVAAAAAKTADNSVNLE